MLSRRALTGVAAGLGRPARTLGLRGMATSSLPPGRRASTAAGMAAVGILDCGKLGLLDDGGVAAARGKRVLVGSPHTYLGRALMVVGEQLGLDMCTKVQGKGDKVDMAILLTPSDDVKAYWRALNYRGSIVVVDSPECGPLMRAHKVVFHTGLSIFKLGSLHGFRLDAWLDSAEHARVARAHSLAADVARSPQGALLSQVPVFPRDEVAVTRSRTTSAKLGQLPSTASAAATSAATVTAVR